jgi:hypothetical protein
LKKQGKPILISPFSVSKLPKAEIFYFGNFWGSPLRVFPCSFLKMSRLSARSLMQSEPGQHSPLEFLVRCGPGHGMASVGHQPELHVVRRGLGDEL